MAEILTVHAPDRQAWRRWLEQHHDRADGVWLERPRKGSRRSSVSYEESVEEALCFGWIDGKVRSVDDEHYVQLFTPRRANSVWAASNKKRVAALRRAGLMTPAGLAAIQAAKRSGAWTALDSVEQLVVPDDLAAALAKDGRARRSFEAFSPSARKAYLYWINDAKRDETRAKRIAITVRLCRQNVKLQDATPEQRRG